MAKIYIDDDAMRLSSSLAEEAWQKVNKSVQRRRTQSLLTSKWRNRCCCIRDLDIH